MPLSWWGYLEGERAVIDGTVKGDQENMELESTTSWSARKRHFAETGYPYMLCHGRAVRPGGMSAKGVITGEQIDGMELCKLCVRCAKSRRNFMSP